MIYMLQRLIEIRREKGLTGLIKKVLCYPFRILFAFSHLNALRSNARKSPEELVDFIFNGYRGIIRPFQIQSELVELIRIASSLKPKTVLEIGTATGGTLYLFACVASPDASIISIDLPYGRFGGGYAFWRIPLYKMFAWGRQKIYLIRRNSHDESTCAKVKTILGRDKVDLLYIDGDHTYQGVKKDFGMYSSFVRKGGFIVMHDIVVCHAEEGCEVHRFWEEIKPDFKCREIITGENQKGGGFGIIGIKDGKNVANGEIKWMA